MLITQNIDGLHTDEVLKSKLLDNVQTEENADGLPLFYQNVVEIQGNARFMQCATDLCDSKYYACPSAEECQEKQTNAFVFENELGEVEKVLDVPRCAKCGNVMKPHILLWDEHINEAKYRTDSVRNFTKMADCLIVVGSELETEKGIRIINSCLRKNIPVIEVNKTCVIKKGHNI